MASVVPLPGSASLVASMGQFIELAVNVPEHVAHRDAVVDGDRVEHRRPYGLLTRRFRRRDDPARFYTNFKDGHFPHLVVPEMSPT